MERILQIQVDKSWGGIESFIYNTYSKINRNRVQFDIIEFGSEYREFNDLFLDLGAKIYCLPNRNFCFIGSYKKIKNILKENEYKIVHIHKNSLADILPIIACIEVGVPHVIIHSHNTSRDDLLIKVIHYVNRSLLNLSRFYCIACSKDAGKWLFGKHSCKIIYNGIDVNKFKYDLQSRVNIRSKYNIKDNEYVIGAIGRITEQKNPIFALNLMNLLKDKNDIKMIWCGEGKMSTVCEKYIIKNNLEENVIFAGKVEEAWKYYSAFDLFIMPSLYEGFPIAVIEARSAGLPCIVSNNITDEVLRLKDIKYLELDLDIWKRTIIECYDNRHELGARSNSYKTVKDAGFDINTVAKLVERTYFELLD